MTTITTGPDGQPRFDGMTGKTLADELHQMASRFADRGFSGSSYMTMEAAAAALRHLSARVAEVEGDAARFRWLIANKAEFHFLGDDFYAYRILWGASTRQETIRDAMDAEMKGDKP